MPYKKFISSFLLIFLFIAGFMLILPANSGQNAKTLVTSHLNQKIIKGENLLYCSTFQLAWNELKNIIKEDIKLVKEPQMVNFLNKDSFSKKDLSENSYLAMAGYGKDKIINRINQGLKNKFGNNAPKVKDQIKPLDIIAYAYLYKNLRFNPTFEPLNKPLKFNSISDVQAFGIESFENKHQKLAEQVKIPYYKNSDDFIVKLTPKNGNDEIFLAKIKHEATLKDTLTSVQNKLTFSRQVYLGDNDTLQIPKFDFKLEHSYDELAGKFLLNKNFRDYFISKAIQNIDFKLNEKGATLKSEAKIILQIECIQLKQPKYMIFDKPFLIYLKEKQAKSPYLVIWVDNTNLLVQK